MDLNTDVRGIAGHNYGDMEAVTFIYIKFAFRHSGHSSYGLIVPQKNWAL